MGEGEVSTLLGVSKGPPSLVHPTDRLPDLTAVSELRYITVHSFPIPRKAGKPGRGENLKHEGQFSSVLWSEIASLLRGSVSKN